MAVLVVLALLRFLFSRQWLFVTAALSLMFTDDSYAGYKARWHVFQAHSSGKTQHFSGNLEEFFPTGEHYQDFIGWHLPQKCQNERHWGIAKWQHNPPGQSRINICFNQWQPPLVIELQPDEINVVRLNGRIDPGCSKLDIRVNRSFSFHTPGQGLSWTATLWMIEFHDIDDTSTTVAADRPLTGAHDSGTNNYGFPGDLFPFDAYPKPRPFFHETSGDILIAPLKLLAQRVLVEWFGVNSGTGDDNELAIRVRTEGGEEEYHQIPPEVFGQLMARGSALSPATWQALVRQPLVTCTRFPSDHLTHQCINAMEVIAQVVDAFMARYDSASQWPEPEVLEEPVARVQQQILAGNYNEAIIMVNQVIGEEPAAEGEEEDGSTVSPVQVSSAPAPDTEKSDDTQSSPENHAGYAVAGISDEQKDLLQLCKGYCLLHQKQYKRTVEILSPLESNDNDSIRILACYWRAKAALLPEGQKETALPRFEKLYSLIEVPEPLRFDLLLPQLKDAADSGPPLQCTKSGILIDYGHCLYNENHITEARKIYEEAKACAPDKEHAVRASLALGNLERRLGQYEREIALYNEALQLPPPTPETRINLLCHSGLALLEKKDTDAAIETLQKALSEQLSHNPFDAETLHKLLTNLGFSYREAKSKDEELSHDQALGLAIANNLIEKVAISYGNLGNYYYQSRQYEKAFWHYKSVWDLSLDPATRKAAGFNLGGALYKLALQKKAEPDELPGGINWLPVPGSLPDLNKVEQLEVACGLLYKLFSENLCDAQKELSHYLKTRQPDTLNRLLGSNTNCFHLMTACLTLLQKHPQALVCLSQMANFILSHDLASQANHGNEYLPPVPIKSPSISYAKALSTMAGNDGFSQAFRQNLREPVMVVHISNLMIGAWLLHNQPNKLEIIASAEVLANHDLKFTPDKYGGHIARQCGLKPSQCPAEAEAAISSSGSNEGSEESSEECTDTEESSESEEDNKESNQSAFQPAWENHRVNPFVTEQLARVFTPIRKALEQYPNLQRLITVVDGQSHLLPYSLIQGTTDSHFLFDRIPLQLVPSLRNVLDHGNVLQLPCPVQTLLVGGLETGPCTLPDGTVVNPAGGLPFSGKEVHHIARRLGSSPPLTGRMATLEVVLGKLETASIIHFACHTLASALHLSATTEEALPYNQVLLTCDRIRQLQLNPLSLVVLSCCDSGNARGQVLTQSSGSSFLSAGAGAVITSMFPVTDESSSLFHTLFYDLLCKGYRASWCLRQSQQLLRLNKQFAWPAHWAGYTLTGHDLTMPAGNNDGLPAHWLTSSIPDPAIATIHEPFSTFRQVAALLYHAVILHGPKGTGVDQLAKEYIRQYAKDYAGGIYWLPLMRYTASTLLENDLKTLKAAILKKGKLLPETEPGHERRILVVIDGTGGGSLQPLLQALKELIADKDPGIRPDILILSASRLKDKNQSNIKSALEDHWATRFQQIDRLDNHQTFLRLASALGERDIIAPTPLMREEFSKLIFNSRKSRLVLPLIEQHLRQKASLDDEALTAELARINLELGGKSMCLDNIVAWLIPADMILLNDQPDLKTPKAKKIIIALKQLYTAQRNKPLNDDQLLNALDNISQTFHLNILNLAETLEELKNSGLLQQYPALDTSHHPDDKLWHLHPVYLNPPP